ncbi:MAG: hypothetical protein LBO04_04890 [Spirochaetaceae bacterium]|nr:hypothetical protein [Spirochaetaceae bacterium]
MIDGDPCHVFLSVSLPGVQGDGGEAGEDAAGVPPAHGVRPRSGKRDAGAAFFRLFPLPVTPVPGYAE